MWDLLLMYVGNTADLGFGAGETVKSYTASNVDFIDVEDRITTAAEIRFGLQFPCGRLSSFGCTSCMSLCQ